LCGNRNIKYSDVVNVEVKIKVSVKKKIKRWRFIGLKVID
jgi:hypothetical protein